MKFRKKKKNKTSSPLYIVPLVNLVFLLLVFLLVTLTSPFKTDKASLSGPINSIRSAANPVNVVVLPEKVVIDGKPGAAPTLSMLPRDKDIIITASREIPYFKVIDILDILRSSGHTRLSIATKPLHN